MIRRQSKEEIKKRKMGENSYIEKQSKRESDERRELRIK